jgi:cell fate (sporulation/competence/biofilm development) regulator YlbF (YheA/YmcA/DUF963 family)
MNNWTGFREALMTPEQIRQNDLGNPKFDDPGPLGLFEILVLVETGRQNEALRHFDEETAVLTRQLHRLRDLSKPVVDMYNTVQADIQPHTHFKAWAEERLELINTARQGIMTADRRIRYVTEVQNLLQTDRAADAIDTATQMINFRRNQIDHDEQVLTGDMTDDEF